MRDFSPKEIEALMATWIGSDSLSPAQRTAYYQTCARFVIHDIPSHAKNLLSDGENLSDLETYCTGLQELLSDLALCEARGILQGRHSKALLQEYFRFPHVDIAHLLRATGVLFAPDASRLEALCREAVEANPKAVEEFRSGKAKALGALVGSVKKQLAADPKDIQDCLVRLISESA